MAQRRGLAGAASGAGTGISEFGDKLLQENAVKRGEDRRAALGMLKDLEDKVAAGTLEPEQAAQIAKTRNIGRDQTYFESLQPSHEHQLGKIVSGITKAGSPQEVPGPQALSYALPGGPKAAVRFGATGQQPDVNQDTGEEQLPSTQMGPVSSPEMQSLLGAREEKLNSFPPTAVANTDPEGNKITEYTNPTKLTGKIARPEPTAQQAGVLAGLKNTLQTKTENDQGLPGLKGQAYKDEHLAGEFSPDITRAKAGQEATVTTAREKASLAVAGSPQALEVRRRQQQVDADVRQAAVQAGMDPSFADNFLHHSAFGSYMYVDSSTPQEERKYVYKIAQQSAKANGVPIRFVNREQENALSLIQRAYDNYTYIADVMSQYASQTASSRVVGGPANTLATAMQTNPQLAAMVTDLPAAMEAAGAQMTGVRGLRMGKELIEHLKNTVPLATDTVATIRYKQIQQAKFLENAALSILK